MLNSRDSITDHPIPGGWSQIEVPVGPHRFRLATPADPDELLNHLEAPEATAQPHLADPYWAKLWPAAFYLAEAIVREPFPAGTRVLELGCGSGLAGIAALATGADVTFSDYVPFTVQLAQENAARNGLSRCQELLVDWRSPPQASFAAIIAADVTYDRQNLDPLLGAIDAMLANDGIAWIADAGRSPAEEFFLRALDCGWSIALYGPDHRPLTQPQLGHCQRFVLRRQRR
jgi:predicted nicotinamide N-methyase